MKFKCRECGKEFQDKPSTDRKCCSLKCSWKSHKIKLICKYCKKEFYVIKSKKYRQFCSVLCRGKMVSKTKQYNKTRIFHHSATIMNKYFNLKRRATRKKLYYLKRKDFENWYLQQEKKCVYCDIPQEIWETLYRGHQGKYSLSLDRMNSELGYEIKNLALACSHCNVIKNDILNFNEMKEIGQKYIKSKWQNKIMEAHNVLI